MEKVVFNMSPLRIGIILFNKDEKIMNKNLGFRNPGVYLGMDYKRVNQLYPCP